ncbi:MAG: hypothetical protein EPO62_05655 [Candidatus Nitrosotenuis sp.]|nr:MAG: hypothetical protein EPO62_05655 [Candidatus Nitrosotenuis sp.]
MSRTLTGISQTVVIQSLEDELKNHQQKYNYHKRIADGYCKIIQQTELKLQEIKNVRYNVR